MNFLHKIAIFICLFSLSLSLLLWGEEPPNKLVVSALSGPSGIGMIHLFENPPKIDGIPSIFTHTPSPDVLLPKLLKGEFHIGILPINVAAKVYNASKGKIILGGVVGQGMLTILSRDTTIKTLEDLKGKKLTIAGQGSTPEYLIRYLSAQKNIPIGRGSNHIQLDFSIPITEIAPALITNKITYALVPQPFSSIIMMQDPQKTIKPVLDLQELYIETTGAKENYPTTGVVVRKEFAQKHPELLRKFLQTYKESIQWVNENPKEAGLLVEKHKIGLKATVATEAIPNSALVWQTAEDAQESIENFLTLFLEIAPSSIGGKIPDEGFYFK